MHAKGHASHVSFGIGQHWDQLVIAILLVLLFLIFLLLFLMITAVPAQAQTLSVMYAFTGGEDGARPSSLKLDRASNLYGVPAPGRIHCRA